MIIREPNQHQDIYEFAAWQGAWDAAENKPMGNYFFGIDGFVCEDCRQIYELAYDLEKESHLLGTTAKHKAVGVVICWDDLHGWGRVIHEGHSSEFSYHANLNEEVFEPHTPVKLEYTYTAGGDREITFISKTTGT